MKLSLLPSYGMSQKYVAPPSGLDHSLPFELDDSLKRHERHGADPTDQMQQLVSALHQIGGRDTDNSST